MTPPLAKLRVGKDGCMTRVEVHEIRNMLQTIVGWNDLGRRDKVSAAVAAMLVYVLNAELRLMLVGVS